MDDLQYVMSILRHDYNNGVLNLVINGWPSIQLIKILCQQLDTKVVLNLVINGWPSIHGWSWKYWKRFI